MIIGAFAEISLKRQSGPPQDGPDTDISQIVLIALLFAENDVGQDTEYQSAGYLSDGNVAELEYHAAYTCDKDDRSGEEVAVVVEIDLLQHLKAGYRDKAVQSYTNAAHDAAGDSAQEAYERSDEGDQHSLKGCNDDSRYRSVLGDSHTAY